MVDWNGIDNDLRQLLDEVVAGYDAFDAAHRRDHALQVMERSQALARRLGADEAMALTIAAYHDTGLVEGRETHHTVSGRIVRGDNRLQQWFSPAQIETMAQAAEDHRASAGHEPRSIYGRIVAEADRMIVPETVIRRTIQYGLDNHPGMSREQYWLRTLEHLREKYGRSGYLRLWLDESDNADRLERLRLLIDSPERLRPVFDRIYDSLQS